MFIHATLPNMNKHWNQILIITSWVEAGHLLFLVKIKLKYASQESIFLLNVGKANTWLHLVNNVKWILMLLQESYKEILAAYVFIMSYLWIADSLKLKAVDIKQKPSLMQPCR